MIVALSTFLVIGCAKEKIETANCEVTELQSGQDIEYIFPKTIGSYWVYNWYQIDSLGVETQMSHIDSTIITGDSIINGHLFTIYEESFFGNFTTKFKRDSSGYIINQFGEIEYSYLDFDNTLSSSTYAPYYNLISKMVDKLDTPIEVPGGVFQTIELQTHITNINGSAISSCAGDTITMPTNYATTVGKVKKVISYISSIPNCQYQEQRLVTYHIP